MNSQRQALAERMVVGGILVAPENLPVVEELLRPEDFADHRHATIYRAAIEVQRSGPVDPVTVSEWLEAQGTASRVGGLPYIGALANDAVSTKAIAGHARIVADYAQARRVAQIGKSLQDVAGSEWAAAVDRAMHELADVGRTRQAADCGIEEAVDSAFAEIEVASQGLVGVPSGITKLDRLTGGFHPGDLVVVGARTGQGKTALMLRFVLGANQPVGIISSEQPRAQIAMRLLAMQAPANLSGLRVGRADSAAQEKVTRAAEQLRQCTIKIADQARPSMAEIRRRARTWQQRHGIKALFVDYLQRLRPEDGSRARHEQIGEIAISLKELARDLNIPVIALAQLNRESENRADPTPRVSDLRDSGQIEQEADLVLLLSRNRNDDSRAELDVAKNRHGPIGLIDLTWKAWCVRFDDYVFDTTDAGPA